MANRCSGFNAGEIRYIFDHMSALFREENFSPILPIDEPVEHDVLLARISLWRRLVPDARIIPHN